MLLGNHCFSCPNIEITLGKDHHVRCGVIWELAVVNQRGGYPARSKEKLDKTVSSSLKRNLANVGPSIQRLTLFSFILELCLAV